MTTTGLEAVNLLNDGSMELGQWQAVTTGGTAILGGSRPRTGLKAQEVTNSAGTDYFKLAGVPVAQGKTYTYSVYINTSQSGITGNGIRLTVKDGTTNYSSDWLKDITTGNTSVSYAAYEWQRLSVTFTPASSSVELDVVYDGITGTVYADDAQLETGNSSSNFSMVNGGSFDNGNMWEISPNNTYDTTIKMGTDGRSVKLTGDPQNYYRAFQSIPVNFSSDYTYKLTGWAQAKSVPVIGSRSFDIHAIVYYSDGSPHDDFYAKFNPDSTQWQYASAVIVPKLSGKTISTIEIYCEYGFNGNTVNFDNISLVREAAQSYKYDDKGNVTSVTTTSNTPLTNTYSGADLMSMVTGDSGAYNYTYDAAHNVKTVVNNGVTMSLSYDSHGNVSSTSLQGTSGSPITTSATYTDNGNLVASVKDSLGTATTYTYSNDINKQLGVPSAIQNTVNPATNYVYNSQNGRLTSSYMTGKISVNPTYTNGLLSSIERNGFDPNNVRKTQLYNFGYNDFGNPLSVIVGPAQGGRTLATYSYADKNGLLKSMSYGNGDSLSYTYDKLFDRLTKLRYNDQTGYDYSYTGEGQLYQVKSADGKNVNTYDYDDIGRLIHFDTKNTDTSISQYFRSTYDTSNRPLGFGYVINVGNVNKINDYEYNYYNTDGTIGSKHTGDGDTMSFGYDALKRLNQKTVTTGSTTDYNVKYGYLGGLPGTTTTLVSGIRYLASDNVTSLRKFGYKYDALGNIITVYHDNSDTSNYQEDANYTYDAQNQLTTENLPQIGLSYTYTYDTYGNIRSVGTTSGGNTTTKEYSYDDANWLDLLTSYDGHSISYDSIGNPLGWYDGTTMTWQHGRQLASLTKAGVTASYAYNADGIRMQKTVGSVVHNYILDGSRILADYMSDGTLIKFAYDQNNVPVSFTVVSGNTSVKYNYVTDLQGDVMEIRDASNNIVGSYVYNAYGQIISKSGAMADINPLRYRGYYYDTETGFYYLNSRYYDPQIGRFINGDAYASTGQGVLGCNMYAYCLNNPVNLSDHSGGLVGIDDATIAVAALALVAGIAIVYIITTPTAQQGWDGLGSAISDTFTSIGNGLKSAWEGVKGAFTSTATSISITQSISKTMSKAKTKIRNERNRYDYWIAAYVDFGDGKGTYVPTIALSFKSAIIYVRGGGNVFADSKTNAYKLALAVGNGRAPTRPERHGSASNGYWYHYHDGNRNGGHIFYVT